MEMQININPNTGEINARPVPCCVRCNKSTNEAYTTGYCNECRSCDICGGEIDVNVNIFLYKKWKIIMYNN